MKKKIAPEQNEFTECDRTFIEATSKIRTLHYIEPINLPDQKEKFLFGRIENPEFRYGNLDYDPDEVLETLSPLKIPGGELGKFYKQKRDELLKHNEVVINRGDSKRVQSITRALYGQPQPELVDRAEDLLENIPKTKDEKDIEASKVKEALEEAIKELGLKDWTVEFSDKNVTTVYEAEKKITVGRGRKFSQLDIKRLPIHEVGVHVARAANGYSQPYKLFAIGLPGYLSTEEGLAVYFEKKLGVQSSEIFRDFAGRVLAIDSVRQGLDFRSTFERLREHGILEDQAWTLCVRAFRAGGYLKDHVYLKGYFQIKDFLEDGGGLRELYVGKVGIKDLAIVRKLIKQQIIFPPQFLPEFVDG